MVKSTTAISKSNIENVLSRIRTISNQTNSRSNKLIQTETTSGFDKLINNIKNGLSKVSETQNETEKLRSAYLTGDPNVPLSEVLVSSARSKVAFEGLVTVRKHFIEAYKEIMSMPI